MYSTNDVGSIAIYMLIAYAFLGFCGLPGAGMMILALLAVIFVSLMLAK
jgi:hypothetical protein